MPWGQGEEDSHTDTHHLLCPYTLISTDLQVQVCTPEQLYIPICTNVVTCIFYFILTCTSHRHLLQCFACMFPSPNTDTFSPALCISTDMSANSRENPESQPQTNLCSQTRGCGQHGRPIHPVCPPSFPCEGLPHWPSCPAHHS